MGSPLGGLSPAEREAVLRYLADRLPVSGATPRPAEPKPGDEAETQRLYERFESDDRAAEISKEIIDLLDELVSMHRAIGGTPDG